MIEVFYPNIDFDTVQDIDLKLLADKKIKGLILDIDNTLVSTATSLPDEKTKKWIKSVKDTGFSVCIVSNGSKIRVDKFIKDLDIKALYRASKPSKKAFIKAAELMGTKISETAVIGDQIFTDVYGGKKVNMFTILVKPLVKKEFFFVRFKRLLEKPILKRYFKQKK